jgi:hypothetical protein
VKLRNPTVRNRCQETAGEDTVGWKMLSGCCGDLWIMEISGGAVIACSSESRVYKWSINPISNPNPVYRRTHNT